jgi:hypothetical protein
MEKGLVPQIGKGSKQCEDEMGVFLFTSYEDCENALLNWLGEEF